MSMENNTLDKYEDFRFQSLINECMGYMKVMYLKARDISLKVLTVILNTVRGFVFKYILGGKGFYCFKLSSSLIPKWYPSNFFFGSFPIILEIYHIKSFPLACGC